MEKCKIGIIGGTGVYQLPGVEQLEKVKVETEYGDVTVNTGTLAGTESGADAHGGPARHRQDACAHRRKGKR